MLKPDQKIRYARHLSLPDFGEEAQQRLLDSTVLLIGAGGLGSPAALYLAAAGVGRLVIVDDDVVDLSNLQRQILHSTERKDMPKADSARQTLLGLNPDIEVIALNERYTEQNARALVLDCDLVLDGADNFPTRYLINDAAYLESKPVVHGSIHLYEGQCTVFARGKGPCYRCLFPAPPPSGLVPSCAEAGVLGVLPGIIGTVQATEAIKLLTGIGEPLIGRLLRYDALSMQFQTLSIRQNEECPLCGSHPAIQEIKEIDYRCTPAVPTVAEINIPEFDRIRRSGQTYGILDIREPHEIAAGCVPGSLPIPIGELENRLDALNEWKEKPLICICQHGIRSLYATAFLEQKGFSNPVSLHGGYSAWLAAQSTGENR